MLAGFSIAAGSGASGGVAIAGMVGVLGLAASLLGGWHSTVAPAVGMLALCAVGANRSSYALVPVESGALVAVALLAWWSLDERLAVAGERGVDAGRVRASAALVVTAACLAVLVIAMASAASPALIGPLVGAVGLASIAAALWAVARLRRYQTEHAEEPVR